jgi:hypothetical protein
VYRFLLADVYALAIRRREIEQVLVDEIVVENGIGRREEFAAFPSDEIRIAWPCPDQINFAHACAP